MQITQQQAMHISNYILKGISESRSGGYNSMEIGISKESYLGIKRKGYRWLIYIKRGKKTDKKVRVPFLTEKSSLLEVSESVTAAINNSVLLADDTLDLSKVPVFDSSEIDLSETDNEVNDESNPVSFAEEIPLEAETSDELNESYPDEDALTYEEVDDKENEMPEFEDECYVEDEIPDDIEETIEKIHENEESDFEEPDTACENPQPQITEDVPENLEESPKEKDTSNFEADDIKNLVKFTMQSNVPAENCTIKNNSYLYRLMENNPQAYLDAINKMNDLLITQDTAVMTSVFIENLNRVLSLYNHDVDQVSDILGLDKRDILLAIYEKKMIG